MKKVLYLVVSLTLVMLFGGMFAYLWPKVKIETFGNNSATLEELFAKQGHYYVYFYRDECRYCANIETEINDFANTQELYRVDTELLSNIQSYDWDQHGVKFDVEIGRIDETGDIEYYHNLNEKDIVEIFPPVSYNIVIATEGYVTLHDEKEEGRVYAVSTHPILNETDLKVENFVLPGVPILVEFDNGKAVNYYFDDKEILVFLESDIEPLGKYWNLH